MDLVSYFWSGKHHRSVKGINLITLYATDQNGQNIPINFRIYDKSESKTKNDYFMDMLSEVLSWGAKIQFITGDSWYSSTGNLKTIRKYGIRFMFGIDCNRKVSQKKDNGFNCVYCQISIRVKWSGSKILALYNYLRLS
jgi:hypothetical protein